ncbi:hypothetical protein JCM10908_004010 [Rhodotorula pacifica]|uniref:uncharacterized protein n=1 Tax=Rhodotorula pacifica TaxID=1495444 RepID=UPI00317EACF8
MAATPNSSDLQRAGSSSSRYLRPNVWLGKAIPLILLVFVWKGWELVLYQIIPHVALHHPRLAGSYAVAMHAALAMTLLSYFKVYLHSQAPPRRREPPEEVQAKRVVFACDEAGAPLRCYRDRCDGAWQTIRTRHCRDCGTCRPLFDHHCAFMDNCIDAETHKAFFCFVAYATVVLGLGLLPLAPPQWAALRRVVRSTWHTETMAQSWWHRWYSWAGGPVWRYAGAVLLGYRQYQQATGLESITGQTNETVNMLPAVARPRSLSDPRLSTLAITGSAWLIFLIALSMVLVVVRNASRGLSTVQIERARTYHAQRNRAPLGLKPRYDARLRLWVTAPDGSDGTVVLVEPDIPLFDFGWRDNLRRAFGDRWWKWLLPWTSTTHSDLDMNPARLAELQKRVHKSA